ncbi:MAG: YceI family protein [Runella sp.]
MKTIKTIAAFLVAGLLVVTTVQATEKNTNKKAVAYKVDASKSVVKWHAKKVTGEHFGTVNLSSGTLSVNGTKIEGGSFEIDMNSIKCTDLTDPTYNNKLITHLKSDDFFSVANHPTAKFVIKKVEGKFPNVNITGDMTIKGITNSITFPATVKADANGVTADAKIVLDRSKWDVRYGSKSFFPNIGDKMIYDDFTIELALATTK